MALSTHSVFYYGIDIDETNNIINFDEGGGELSAAISVGSYAVTDFLTQIKTAMDAVGGQAYTVSFDRDTRLVTISASGTFSLLVSTGTQIGVGVFLLMGFTGADRTSTNSYTGNAGAASSYEPQFVLQSYISSDDSQELVDASVSESASGKVQVISYGTRKFFELNITLATNVEQSGTAFLKNNPSGVSDLRDFMQSIIKKGEFEFMPDINSRSSFSKVILESTPDSSVGTSYKLKELYSRNLPGYFETGLLRLRLIE